MTVGHHTNLVERAPGIFRIARPPRHPRWWTRYKQERACLKTTEHCWHPQHLINWWCCMCSAETDGMPTQRCVHCTEDEVWL